MFQNGPNEYSNPPLGVVLEGQGRCELTFRVFFPDLHFDVVLGEPRGGLEEVVRGGPFSPREPLLSSWLKLQDSLWLRAT